MSTGNQSIRETKYSLNELLQIAADMAEQEGRFHDRDELLILANINPRIDEDGSKKWYLNGERHREDGPAIEWASGSKKWYLNGELHREDGPTCEWADGSKE